MKNTDLILPLTSVSKKDVPYCGGKGANLGELVKSGIPVPPGFIIPTSVYDRYFNENNLNSFIKKVLSKYNLDNYNELKEVSTLIERAVISGKILADDKSEIMKYFKELTSEFVAVRSSATSEDLSEYSWAGQLSTFLNTSEKKLFENIKKCWASLYSDRAISYRLSKKLLDSNISVGIVVQEMVDSEVSGIAFTANPVTKDSDMIVIEAVLGLGEAAVSGMVTPDSYIVNKKDFTIFDCKISMQKEMIKRVNGKNMIIDAPEKKRDKRKLTESKITKLAKQCIKIEELFGTPQDIEWSFDKGKLYILQSRPITTL